MAMLTDGLVSCGRSLPEVLFLQSPGKRINGFSSSGKCLDGSVQVDGPCSARYCLDPGQ